MNRLGIKYQLLLITLLPVLLIDLFFTYTHFESSIQQANELIQSKGQIIAKQLAGASEFDLISGQDQQIQYMLDQSIDTNAVILISVYDLAGNLIAKSESAEFRRSEATDYFYYRTPVTSQNISHSDVFTPGQVQITKKTTVGWVHLYISRQQLEAAKARIAQQSIVLFVIILVLFVTLAAFISRRITQPIFTLLEHLNNVEAGQLGETIDPLAYNEIGAVQKGFNRMTQALFNNQRYLNNKIQQATYQLNGAISGMETKNRELVVAKDEAQNANNVKSKFLANMSHEVRTPLNGIKGFVSLMKQSGLSPTQEKYADIVLESTIDLTNIIEEILDFSKIESGKLQVIEDEFDLHRAIEQTRDSLFITMLAKDIDLNLIIYSDTPQYVSGDRLRLKQILLNLIGNAIKFTDQGGVVIRVTVEEQIESEVTVLISIEDTGIGIAESEQSLLFTAFSQVETAANRRFGGTGLGLAISKNLAVLMGGDITLKSELSKGSMFALRLPLKLASNASQYIPEQQDGAKTAVIVASQKICLQELQSLYDRAGITTESILLEAYTIEKTREKIHQNSNLIDYLVIDFRHLDFDLAEIVDTGKRHHMRIIAMHYNPDMIPGFNGQKIEFISIINSSKGLQGLLDKPAIDTSEEKASDQHTQVPSHPKHVLIVDDNEINLKLGGELIRLWGHRVCEASHANEAMMQYRNQEFDLIILDIQMPDIDGVTLLNMMRKERPESHTPIAALTANILDQEGNHLLELGFDYYLSKPIDEVAFQDLVNGSPVRSITKANVPDNDEQYGDTVSVNIRQSLGLAANNESLLQQLFRILLRDIPGHKDQLSATTRQLDYEKLSTVVHKIHGVTCYASLPRLKAQVLSIQQQLAEESYSFIEVAVDSMIDELEQIRLQIEMYLQQAMDGTEY